MQKSGRILSVILLAIFLDLLCNGILVPIVPQLLANPGSEFYLLPASVPISYGYIVLGLLIATFPFFLFFANPVMGEYSDYVGRRKVMVITLTGSAISLGLFAFGVSIKSLTILFISRIIGGIMGGNLSVAQAAIADITPPKLRAQRFGLIGAAYGVGFIVGPVIGALLSSKEIIPWFNASTPFWFAAFLYVIDASLVFFLLKETRVLGEAKKLKFNRAVMQVLHAYKMKNHRIIFVTNFLFQAGLALFATFFSVFLIAMFGFNQVSVGYYIAYAGVWLIITQALILRPLAKRFDEITLLKVSLFLGAGSVFLYHFAVHISGLLIVGACFALTNGIAMAILPTLVSNRTSADNQGEILGINSSVQALAQTIPPIIAGFLAAKITPSAPVYVAGATIGLAWVVFILFVKRTKVSN